MVEKLEKINAILLLSTLVMPFGVGSGLMIQTIFNNSIFAIICGSGTYLFGSLILYIGSKEPQGYGDTLEKKRRLEGEI